MRRSNYGSMEEEVRGLGGMKQEHTNAGEAPHSWVLAPVEGNNHQECVKEDEEQETHYSGEEAVPQLT